MAELPVVKPGYHKLAYGFVLGLAAYGTTHIPSVDTLPTEVTTAFPALVAGIVFWLVPEKYLVKIGDAFEKARNAE